MSVFFDVAHKDFAEQLDGLVKATGKEAGRVVRDEARLFVKDVVKHTPPFGETPSTETLNHQRKIGEAAVERDIRRAFVALEELKVMQGEETALVGRLRELARQGKVQSIHDILRDELNFKNPNVAARVDPEWHETQRDKRGRVPGGKRRPRMVILNEGTIRKQIRAKQRRVGKAKGGWAAAADALGVKLPGWIKRHGSPGQVQNRLDNIFNPSITMANLVGYIQGTGAELQIVNRALRNRVKVMKLKLERILTARKKGWRPPGE